MEKYKTFTYLFGFLSLILLLMVIFGGKETTYVCYDGTEESKQSDCKSSPPLTITAKAAKDAVTDYVNSYARSKPGLIGSVIGEVSRQNNSYISDVTFANSRTSQFNELTFLIDGKTSSVTCIEGCAFLKIDECCACNVTDIAG
jgi:hypothetical protein